MRRIIPALALVLAVATGCSTDSTGPNGSIVGTYSLRTINGYQLPYTVQYNQAITSGSVSLNSDGSYSETVQYNDGSYRLEQGYYTQQNNAITFNDYTDNYQYQGSISGNILTEIDPGYTATFQKN